MDCWVEEAEEIQQKTWDSLAEYKSSFFQANAKWRTATGLLLPVMIVKRVAPSRLIPIMTKDGSAYYVWIESLRESDGGYKGVEKTLLSLRG
jgi:hypothetical protein